MTDQSAVLAFETRLTIDSVTSNRDSDDVSATIYNYRAPLAPGLYQVIATRDRKSGQVGSIQQWIEIPDLALHRLVSVACSSVDGMWSSEDQPPVGLEIHRCNSVRTTVSLGTPGLVY